MAVGVSLKQQYAAVATMRWRLLLNTFRTRRGGFELGARIVTQFFFMLIGLSVAIGLGFGAWQLAQHQPLSFITVLLWPILVFWQIVPIGIASFQENADLSLFLRFPLGFGSYVLFYILFGLFDVGTLIGGVALLGIFVGASIAQPVYIPSLAVALGLFAIFNVFLTRMIFSWIDRWLAQRKTREILGAIFLFLMLGLQLLNPAFYAHSKNSGHAFSRSSLEHALHTANAVQAFLPPGLAANAIGDMQQLRPLPASINLLFLALYATAAATLLCVRLRAEYRGESLGEAPARGGKTSARESRSLIEGPGPLAAVIEKEIRYLMRSGIMLYGFLAPLFMVFVFSNNGSRFGSQAGLAAQYALPLGVAYSFLGLTRFIYNNLGGEGAGIQLYFLSPTPFRKVFLAKNLVHAAIFFVELVLVCIIVSFRSGLPSPQMLVITFAWLLFALPAQLAIGNVLSITMPYRMNMTRMSREQGAAGNGLLSLLMQLVIFGVGAAVYYIAKTAGHLSLAAPILLVFAMVAIFAWWRTLANAGFMIDQRRESLITTLYRAT